MPPWGVYNRVYTHHMPPWGVYWRSVYPPYASLRGVCRGYTHHMPPWGVLQGGVYTTTCLPGGVTGCIYLPMPPWGVCRWYIAWYASLCVSQVCIARYASLCVSQVCDIWGNPAGKRASLRVKEEGNPAWKRASLLAKKEGILHERQPPWVWWKGGYLHTLPGTMVAILPGGIQVPTHPGYTRPPARHAGDTADHEREDGNRR